MIFAILVTIGLLGAVWVYLIPMLMGPASSVFGTSASNKWVQLGITGAFLLLTIVVVGFIVKTLKFKEIAAA